MCIGFHYGIRSCSCYDNEQFHYPIDNSGIWIIRDNSVRGTIAPNFGTSIYNAFGIVFKVDTGNV